MRFADACFAAVVTLTVLGVSHADDSLPYEQKKDVVYAEAHGTGLLMDVFTPTGNPNGLGIVDIASGSWYSDRNKIRDHTLAQVYTIFCSRGYTVFAVRPGSKTRYTAGEMDRNVKSAIRYVKAHAGEHKIDPARLGITGGSAGGHLATLAALTPEPGKTDAKDSIDRFDTSMRAVGVFFPPTDFLDWDGTKAIRLDVLGPLLFVGGAKRTLRGRDQEGGQGHLAAALGRETDDSVPFDPRRCRQCGATVAVAKARGCAHEGWRVGRADRQAGRRPPLAHAAARGQDLGGLVRQATVRQDERAIGRHAVPQIRTVAAPRASDACRLPDPRPPTCASVRQLPSPWQSHWPPRCPPLVQVVST